MTQCAEGGVESQFHPHLRSGPEVTDSLRSGLLALWLVAGSVREPSRRLHPRWEFAGGGRTGLPRGGFFP